MRVILRRELIGKTAVMIGTAAAPLLAKAALAQTQADGRSNMSDMRLSSLVDALHADHPAADRADKMGLYGWLIGRWTIDAIYHLNEGTICRSRGEIHAGWVLEGRAHGDDIVQDGTDETGAPVRWSFTEITPNSFRWLGERSADGGTTFRLLVEFLARRI